MTTRLAHCFLLCSFMIFSCHQVSIAQNAPVTTATTIAGAVPGTVDVPLTVTGFNDIGAISLSLSYDYSVLHFTGGTPNPVFQSFPIGDLDLGDGFHRITMGWFGSGVTLNDGSTIMTLHFTFISGISTLQWHDSGPSCEYTDADYNVLNDIPASTYYKNGNVCGVIGNPGAIAGNSTVCQGETAVTYSVDPIVNATGYIWSVPDGVTIIAGQNTNVIMVDFADNAVSGNISVYGINNCGNGPVSQLSVIVNTLPVANAGDDISIPHGTSTYLDSAPGGTGTFSYHWSPEELLVDPDVQNPQTVILTSTTVFSLSVTNITTLCQNNDEMTVTITGGPLSVNPLALPASVCQGESSQLYANAGGGSGSYTYQWTSEPPGNPPWNSTQQDPVVIPDSSTQYLLTVYDGFTTLSGSSYVSVSLLPSAFIYGGDTLCGSDVFTTLQVDLTGIPPWSFTYSYGNTSVFIVNQQTSPYLITASDPGDYIITAIEDANCSGTSSGTAIVRKYLIPATPEITLYGLELISSSCCGNQWYKNDIAIPGQTGQTCHATESGLYFVIVTLNSCSSEPSEVVDLVVAIHEQPFENRLALNNYPNPFSNFTTISYNVNYIGLYTIEIYNSMGMMVSILFNIRLSPGNHTLKFDGTGLLPGIYTVKLSSQGTATMLTHRILKL